MEQSKKEAAQCGQQERVRFRRGGSVIVRGKFFDAPDLNVLHGKVVTAISPATVGAGLQVIKIYHQGRHVTDAINAVRVPLNKNLDRLLRECTEKQQGLYL